MSRCFSICRPLLFPLPHLAQRRHPGQKPFVLVPRPQDAWWGGKEGDTTGERGTFAGAGHRVALSAVASCRARHSAKAAAPRRVRPRHRARHESCTSWGGQTRPVGRAQSPTATPKNYSPLGRRAGVPPPASLCAGDGGGVRGVWSDASDGGPDWAWRCILVGVAGEEGRSKNVEAECDFA